MSEDDDIKLIRVATEVQVQLDGGEALGLLPIRRDVEQALCESFGFREWEVSQDENQGWLWHGAMGALKLGDSPVQILHAIGSEFVLHLALSGNADQADAALGALWDELVPHAGEVTRTLDDFPTRHYRTTAAVVAPRSFEEYVPFARHVRKLAEEALPVASKRRPDYSFAIDLPPAPFDVPERRITIEPAVAADDERLLFTRSPLRTDEHMDFLRKALLPRESQSS